MQSCARRPGKTSPVPPTVHHPSVGMLTVLIRRSTARDGRQRSCRIFQCLSQKEISPSVKNFADTIGKPSPHDDPIPRCAWLPPQGFPWESGFVDTSRPEESQRRLLPNTRASAAYYAAWQGVSTCGTVTLPDVPLRQQWSPVCGNVRLTH